MKRYTVSMNWKIQCTPDVNFPKVNCRLDTMPIKIPAGFFGRLDINKWILKL